MLSQEYVKQNDSILPHLEPGSLSGGIAHDCNSILAGIVAHVELALLTLSDGNLASNHLRKILSGCFRIQDLVRQNEGGGQAALQEWKPVQLRGIVEELLGLLRPSLHPTTHIYLNLGCNLSTIRADQSQMYQVLLNILKNAGEAMSEAGGVLLIVIKHVMVTDSLIKKYSVLKRGPHVQLTVRDSGIGMTPEVQTRIFERNFSTKRVREGTGIGLGSVQAIIRNHGGEIQVDSVFGKGTTLTIHLPSIADGPRSDEECDVDGRWEDPSSARLKV